MHVMLCMFTQQHSYYSPMWRTSREVCLGLKPERATSGRNLGYHGMCRINLGHSVCCGTVCHEAGAGLSCRGGVRTVMQSLSQLKLFWWVAHGHAVYSLAGSRARQSHLTGSVQIKGPQS